MGEVRRRFYLQAVPLACISGSQSDVSKDTLYVCSEGLRLGSPISLKSLAGLSPPAHPERINSRKLPGSGRTRPCFQSQS